MMVELYSCKLLKKTFEGYKRDKRVVEAFKAFVRQKSESPLEPYGSKDYPFKSGVGTEYKHAALTHDIRIIYKLVGKNPYRLELYGIFSHDESGTGQPPNPNRARALVDKLGNQELEVGLKV